MILLRILLFCAIACTFASCASEAELAQRDREDALRDLQDAREEGRREAAEFNEFLVGYARGIGKTPSQLTRAEREEAHRLYSR